jgi:small subunit ribosomal protein S6
MAIPNRSYNYEAMFLLSQATAADLASAIDHIKEVLARGHAEIIAMKKWDERRLAFEIKKQKRGLYILVYFRAPNSGLPHIERDCNLSDKILRVLILRADHLSIEEMQSADGQKELEVEARLRAEQAAKAPQTPEAVGAGTGATPAAGSPVEGEQVQA